MLRVLFGVLPLASVPLFSLESSSLLYGGLFGCLAIFLWEGRNEGICFVVFYLRG